MITDKPIKGRGLLCLFCAECRLHNSSVKPGRCKCHMTTKSSMQHRTSQWSSQTPICQPASQRTRHPHNVETGWRCPCFSLTGTSASTRNSLWPELRACFPHSKDTFLIPKLWVSQHILTSTEILLPLFLTAHEGSAVWRTVSAFQKPNGQQYVLINIKWRQMGKY